MTSSQPEPFSAEIMKVLLEGDLLVGSGRKRQQILALDAVDLVEHQDLRLFDLLQALEDCLGIAAQAPFAVDEQHDEVGVLGAAPGRSDHGAVEPATRLEDAGRVHEHDLRIVVDGNAADDRACRLHLVADDRDFRTDQPVEQRRLAGIGRTDQGYETGMGRATGLRHAIFGGGVIMFSHFVRRF